MHTEAMAAPAAVVTPIRLDKAAAPAPSLAMEKALDDSIAIQGHPWAKGSYAAFALAALFHDRPARQPGQRLTVAVPPAAPETAMPAAEPGQAPPAREGFTVSLRSSTLDKMPPVPSVSLMGASSVMPDVMSLASASSAIAAPDRNPDTDADADAIRADVLARWHALAHDPSVPLPREGLAVAAFMTLWRVARETGLVCGGFLFHRLHDPSREQPQDGEDVRLVWERTGPAAEQALLQAEDGGSFSLLR